MHSERSMLVRTDDTSWSAPEVTAYENEAHLQTMLAEQPGWIPGVDDRAFTAQELQTTAGPIDVCIIGGDGSLTVVECKLASSSEKRRMVVGQVIDYASAIWLSGAESFNGRWLHATGQELGDLLPDTSMQRLAANIESARIDLCLAVDEIDDDLRRLIEYLNKATRPDVRVTAVQLSYARQGSVEILVPTTYGGEIAETKSRAAGRPTLRWTVETFIEALGNEADRVLAQRLIDLTGSAEGPNRQAPILFGIQPGGGIYLHPGGVSHPPAWIWANSRAELTICGTWNNGKPLAHHSAYEPLAWLFEQDHLSGAKGVRVSSVGLDELWAALIDCAAALDAVENIE